MRADGRNTTSEALHSPASEHSVETIASLDRIPIVECGEPLVELRTACPALVLVGKEGEPPLLARRSIADRLNCAQAFLDTHHPGYRLRVGDAWRDLGKQVRFFRLALRIARLLHPFWSRERLRELANKYIAAPDALAPPPHTTGGAVDVTLLQPDGQRAFMGPFRPTATRTHYPHLSPTAKQNRAILCAAMEHAGFSNYAEEWWHWSYGDSGWALRTHQPHALYGLITSSPTG